MPTIQKMGVEYFVRHLKCMLQEQDGHFAFFLGAGCSISAGVSGAKALVEHWMPTLHTQMTGRSGTPDSDWLKTELRDYDASNPAASYARVMRRLFPRAVERQREIERIVRGQDPGFGYAVFAKLITLPDCGHRCNLVLTTNFDDLVADALYLYTQQKPLVIVHESLVGFVETGRTRPLVIKVHGDALLEPKNTEEEIRSLDEKVLRVLAEQLSKRGLIFVGYGGNDTGVTSFLKELPREALTWGIYWINKTIPNNDFGKWLQSRPDCTWVDHLDFDELMILIRSEFNLDHPKEARFEKLMVTYMDTFERLTKGVGARPESEEKEALKSAVEKATEEATDWWKVVLKAKALEQSDPARADEIYRAGVEKLPRSPELLNSYAIFLASVRKELDKAEIFFHRAIEEDPNNVSSLGNYAYFLFRFRKRFDEAESYYRRAINADPKKAWLLGTYAVFLEQVRKDFDQAEVFYRRAIDADPTNANNLGNYALFLHQVRKDFEQAESFYRRAIEAEPNHATNLGGYAELLHQVRKDFEQAESFYRRAIDADPNDAYNLGNYADFLEYARKDFEQAESFYRRAIEADSNNADNLGSYASFLQTVRKDFEQAESFYRRAIDADPNNAPNLGNYGGFLLARGKQEAGLDFVRRSMQQAARPLNDTVMLECHFYLYAHGPAENRGKALSAIRSLLLEDFRSPGWDFSQNIERAEKDGHPNVALMKALAAVINESAAISTLDEFEEWRNAGSQSGEPKKTK